MKLSVVICTWNRAKLLERALDRMASVTSPTAAWELIVVNNNCTDETEHVLDAFAPRLPLRRLFEPEPGQSNARNAAVQSASGEYIIWTDDDVLMDKEWLVAYERAFRRWPEAAVFGGPIRPLFEGTPPEWLSAAWKDVSNAFAVRDLGAEPVELDGKRATPYGANFAVRLSEQRKFPYDPGLGRKMQYGLLGDDVTVIRAILNSGHTGWWIPDASVDHFIPRERQTLAYIKDYFRLSGRTAQKLSPGEGPTWFGRPRWVWRKAIEAEIAFWFARLGGDPRDWIKPLCEASYYRGMLTRADR